MITDRKIPLYANLIHFHNNIWVASNVSFITHDVTHAMLNRMGLGYALHEKVGCIEIMDNVFIGSGSKIMYGVRVGTNVIIAAGSVVTKDVPDNTVVGGVPAKPICSFEEYVSKREKQDISIKSQQYEVAAQDQARLWQAFYADHNKKSKC